MCVCVGEWVGGEYDCVGGCACVGVCVGEWVGDEYDCVGGCACVGVCVWVSGWVVSMTAWEGVCVWVSGWVVSMTAWEGVRVCVYIYISYLYSHFCFCHGNRHEHIVPCKECLHKLFNTLFIIIATSTMQSRMLAQISNIGI